MIKQIIFDLDGVLLDFCDIHYECFKEAVLTYTSDLISKEVHDKELNGLPTKVKLKKLGYDDAEIDLINDEKQKLTQQALDKITLDHDLITTLNELRRRGLELYCVSNSIFDTIQTALVKLGIAPFFKGVVANDSKGVRCKPHPDMYLECMMFRPEEVLIIEDSDVGLRGARRSGANVMAVKNRSEVTLENIEKEMAKYTIPTNINILIPAAGRGSRFAQVGYKEPKPFIPIDGQPMINYVIKSIGIDGKEIYIMQIDHFKSEYSGSFHGQITYGKTRHAITISGVTEGAACTTLLAKSFIDNDSPLLICNSDQIFDWDREEFFNQMQRGHYDAGILVFNANETKWSYAKVDPRDRMTVTEVAEKKVISDLATVGAYYWKRGSDYVKYAEQMISKNIRVNNEFYVCPVFNEAIKDGRRVLAFKVNEMWGLGTPEDLEVYLARNK